MPARPKCPDCHVQLRVKALSDSDQRILQKWRYCEECGWDERGKFDVTVWDHEGEIVECARDINQSQVDDLREKYADDPWLDVVVEEVPQNELQSA